MMAEYEVEFRFFFLEEADSECEAKTMAEREFEQLGLQCAEVEVAAVRPYEWPRAAGGRQG